MNHGSLFSGIGGFDLAAEWMGWDNIFHCEWNEFGQKVLNHYWPKAISYNDITKTDFTIHRGSIDILTGGFPCQPYSMAGKRKGKEDERHLWPEMLRAIREIQPRWVVGENVFGIINWNGGMVFDEVQTDLEAEGYEVFPYVLPACAVNAPHRRDRVWFVAYSNKPGADERVRTDGNGEKKNEGRQGQSQSELRKSGGFIKNTNHNGWGGDIGKEKSGEWRFGDIGTGDNERVRTDNAEARTTTNTDSLRHRGGSEQPGSNKPKEWQMDSNEERNGYGVWSKASRCSREINDWQNFPTQSPICNGDDGLSSRLDSITFSKWRNESIKAGGNAVVPQVVLQIFKAIEQYENLT